MYAWFLVPSNSSIVLISSTVCDRWVTKKKRRIVTRNYDVVVFGDHGNNALPLSIPELDLIGGVARGLAEGRSVLARSKPGYVKRYEIYKQLCS